MSDNLIYGLGDHLDSRIDYASSTISYFGSASPGSATSSSKWQIRRQTKDSQGRTTKIEFAAQKASFDQVWDNRATLTYGP